MAKSKLKLHVQVRCDKCSNLYEFDDDDSLFFLGIDPGKSVTSFERPCTRCGFCGITIVGVSTRRDPLPDEEDEWPDVIDA